MDVQSFDETGRSSLKKLSNCKVVVAGATTLDTMPAARYIH